MQHSAILNVMIAAARKAARAIKRDFGELEKLQVSLKAPPISCLPPTAVRRRPSTPSLTKQGPVMDFSAKKVATAMVQTRVTGGLSIRWTGPPIFFMGFRTLRISIALEREGIVVAGLIYNPAIDELFVAERGKGAFLNEQRIRVAARKRLAEAIIGCGIAHYGHGDMPLSRKEIGVVQEDVAGSRRFGASALDLAWVAAGRLDGYWEREPEPLGYRRRRNPGARGRWFRHRLRRPRGNVRQRACLGRKRDYPQRASGSAQGRRQSLTDLISTQSTVLPDPPRFPHNCFSLSRVCAIVDGKGCIWHNLETHGQGTRSTQTIVATHLPDPDDGLCHIGRTDRLRAAQADRGRVHVQSRPERADYRRRSDRYHSFNSSGAAP